MAPSWLAGAPGRTMAGRTETGRRRAAHQSPADEDPAQRERREPTRYVPPNIDFGQRRRGFAFAQAHRRIDAAATSRNGPLIREPSGDYPQPFLSFLFFFAIEHTCTIKLEYPFFLKETQRTKDRSAVCFQISGLLLPFVFTKYFSS